MLIDFDQAKQQQFIQVAHKIMAKPEVYVQFDSVADFYAAPWLTEFPVGTMWQATGLDDGAEQFYAQIYYRHLRLNIDVSTQLKIELQQ